VQQVNLNLDNALNKAIDGELKLKNVISQTELVQSLIQDLNITVNNLYDYSIKI